MKKIREMLRLKEECRLSLRMLSQAMKISRPVITEFLAKCTQKKIDYQTVKELPDDEIEKLLIDDPLILSEENFNRGA